MSFLHMFYPDEYLDSTYEIDFDLLYKKGYRGVIFDIDNTLVPHGAPADARAEALFSHLKSIGFSCCLLSNNQRPRVELFNKNIGVNFIEDAHKPSVKSYQKAMKMMGTDIENTLFVGDQLFTDIYGAKKCGIDNIYVNRISDKEEIQIVLKRKLERIVFHAYRRHSRLK